MIEFISGDHVKINGSLMELVSDSIHMVSDVYNAIKEDDEKLAEEYKKDITNMLYIAFLSDDEIRDEANKQKDEFKRRINDILDKLNELFEKSEKEEKEKNKDIRSADFDSDDEFAKWFHSDSEEE